MFFFYHESREEKGFGNNHIIIIIEMFGSRMVVGWRTTTLYPS